MGRAYSNLDIARVNRGARALRLHMTKDDDSDRTCRTLVLLGMRLVICVILHVRCTERILKCNYGAELQQNRPRSQNL